MSTPHARQGEARRDHYAEITNQIIAALKAGTPPWRCDWDKTKTGGPASPQNASTGARRVESACMAPAKSSRATAAEAVSRAQPRASARARSAGSPSP